MSDHPLPPQGLPPLDAAAVVGARTRTIARGRHLRARRRVTIAGGVATALAVLIAAFVVFGDDPGGDDTVDVVDDRTTTTAEDDDGRASRRPTTTDVPAGPETTTTSDAPRPDPQPEADDADDNADDNADDGAAPPVDDGPPPDEPRPQCTTVTGQGSGPRPDWAQWWTAEPADNDPMTLELCISDVSPRVGEPIEMTAQASDPDAGIFTAAGRGFCPAGVPCQARYAFGDGAGSGGRQEPPPGPPAEPQPLPPESPGQGRWYGYYAYSAPGTYVASFLWYSGGGPIVETADGTLFHMPSPYSSPTEATLVVTVSE